MELFYFPTKFRKKVIMDPVMCLLSTGTKSSVIALVDSSTGNGTAIKKLCHLQILVSVNVLKCILKITQYFK